MSADLIGALVLLVILLAGAYWYLYMRCPLTLPSGAAKLADAGSGYCGVADYQPNAGSNAGDAAGNVASAAACAKICDGRAGCTGYKYWGEKKMCFPLKTPDAATTSAALAAAQGWDFGYKIAAQ